MLDRLSRLPRRRPACRRTGADWLEGGNGADTFCLSATAPGVDRIADFDPDEGDVIALARFEAGFDFAALDTNDDGLVGEGDAGVTVEPDVLTLGLGGGVEIELAGVAALGPDAFLFIA